MELPKGVKLLIFDFDGTLLNLEVDWGAIRRDLGIAGTNEKIGDVLQRMTLANDPLLMNVTRYELAALGGGRVAPAMVQTLAVLSDRCKLAVFSRNSRQVLEQAFAGTPLAGKLFIVGREDTKRLKPDPEGIYIILQHFDIQPAQAVLIGDTYHDVQAAHAAGVMSMIVRNKRLAYQPEGADAYIEAVTSLK